MNIKRLAEYLNSINDQDAEITNVTLSAGHIWIDCILPVTPERDEFHKRLVHFIVPVEGEF